MTWTRLIVVFALIGCILVGATLIVNHYQDDPPWVIIQVDEEDNTFTVLLMPDNEREVVSEVDEAWRVARRHLVGFDEKE